VLFFAALGDSAQAAPESIAEFGEDAGQVNLPVGAAVHQATGSLYIADQNNFRIDKFDADGNFALAWGWGVRDGLESGLQTCGPQASPPTSECFPGFASTGAGGVVPTGVAVDQTSGAVYVTDRLRVSKFTSSGEFLFSVGRNVNETKVAEAGATQAEKNICTAVSGDTCGGGEAGTGPSEFETGITSVAVDPTGVVWVGTTDRLTSFDAGGTAGAEISMPGAGFTRSLAADSAGNLYVISESLAGVRKLEAGTGVLLLTLDAAGQPRTVAVDEDDDVYVGDETSPYRFKVYDSAGEQKSQFGTGQVIGAPGAGNIFGGNALAIDKNAGKLYAASSSPNPSESVVQAFSLPEPGPLVERQDVEDVLPTTATLTATINPEGAETTYRFEYGTSESYGQSTPTQTLSADGFEGVPAEAQVAQLLPDTTYHFRVVATNHCNPSEPTEDCTALGDDQTFTTPAAIAIGAEWATDVTANSAVLHAEFNPLGVEAEAWVEYGTSESYGTTVALANLGEGFGTVTRQAFLSGLQVATTYHFRFVARDERDGIVYTISGADRTFATQSGGLGFELTDGRVWEMVSPSNKHGARLLGGGEVHLQASADGDGLAYQSKLSTEADPDGNRIPEASMNLARRGADGSWSSQDITPSNDGVTGIQGGNGTEYKLFSSDLSEALLEPRSDTPLSPEASERTPYLRENTNSPVYTPLLTGKEPFANVPPGVKFGGQRAIPDVSVVGASPDFGHFALRSVEPLVEGTAVSGSTLYEWSGGQIKPVSVAPAGEGGELVGATFVGSGPGSVRGAVSEDGSRVFWSIGSESTNTTALYVRDTVSAETARLDVAQGGSGEGSAHPVFQGASADGTVVFFTDPRQLTADASSDGSDLYRCELPSGGVASGCATLTDITVSSAAGESAEVQGVAAALTENGAAIYFVARGVLDEIPNQTGDSATPGAPNLYLWQEGEGARFIATLAEEDETSWGGSVRPVAANLSAAASPDGRYLAFMSQRSLSGYDNRDASTGEPAQELFRYDALVDRLACVSCNPTGARPHGVVAPKEGSLVNPTGLWAGQRTAATIPMAISLSLGGISLYRPRAVLDNGRVLFNAVDSLVPADSNGQWDVYQYEPTGAGGCLESSGGASVARSAGGCVSLISSGTAEEEAAFFDASETGDDAFFFTPARLSVLDEDNEVDIYDARVDGVVATLPVNTECLGEACQPAPQVPSDPTPASAAFHGSGNAPSVARKKCPKGKRRVQRHGRVRCVPRKHRRAGSDRQVTR